MESVLQLEPSVSESDSGINVLLNCVQATSPDTEKVYSQNHEIL